jgi:hypothetical protein
MTYKVFFFNWLSQNMFSVICSVADKFKLSTAAQITQNDCLKASDWLLTLILTNLSISHTVVLFSLYFSHSLSI